MDGKADRRGFIIAHEASQKGVLEPDEVIAVLDRRVNRSNVDTEMVAAAINRTCGDLEQLDDEEASIVMAQLDAILPALGFSMERLTYFLGVRVPYVERAVQQMHKHRSSPLRDAQADNLYSVAMRRAAAFLSTEPDTNADARTQAKLAGSVLAHESSRQLLAQRERELELAGNRLEVEKRRKTLNPEKGPRLPPKREFNG